jgi:large repetitive protein
MRRLVLIALVASAGGAIVPGVAQADSTLVVGSAPACPGAQFSDLQTAVNFAQSHDTIRICPGTYDVGPAAGTTVPAAGLSGLKIDKALTIIGAGAGKVTIEPTQDLAGTSATDNPRDALGNVITVTNTSPGDTSDFDVNVAISGVTITDGGHRIDAGVAFNNAAGSIEDSTIGPLAGSMPPAGGPQSGWGVVASNNFAVTPQGAFVRDVTVSSDNITGYGAGGVLIDGSESTKPIYFRSGVSTTGTITNNVITGSSDPTLAEQYGVQVNGGARATISGNVISGNLGASAASTSQPGSGVGILLTDADVTSTAVGSTTSFDTAVGGNDLIGNGYGLFNGTADFPAAAASDPDHAFPIDVNGTGTTPSNLPASLNNTALGTTVSYDVPGVALHGATPRAGFYGSAGPVLGGPSTASADGVSESSAGGGDSVITGSAATTAFASPAAPGPVADAPPAVQFGTPSGVPGESLTAGQANELLAVATDDFAISSVTITADGTPLGTLTAAPYRVDWTPPTSLAGAVVPLTATATDESGQVSSATIDVAVVVPPAAPAAAGPVPPATTGGGTPPAGPGAPSGGSPTGHSAAKPSIHLAADLGSAAHPLRRLHFAPRISGGAVSVTYRLDGRVVCRVNRAPFACTAALTGRDPGAHTLTIVVRTAHGTTATLTRRVHIAPLTRGSLTATATATGRDLLVRGSLALPAHVTQHQACDSGRVIVSAAGRRADIRLGATCQFQARLAGVDSGARVRVSFTGNRVLAARSRTIR